MNALTSIFFACALSGMGTFSTQVLAGGGGGGVWEGKEGIRGANYFL